MGIRSAFRLGILLGLLAQALPAWGEEASPFPLPPGLERNVAFWKRIFVEFRTTDYVIHDRENLDVIYDVVSVQDLFGSVPPTERQIGEAVARVRQRYAETLRRMAAGDAAVPLTAEETRAGQVLGCPCPRERLAEAAERVHVQRGVQEKFAAGLARGHALSPRVTVLLRRRGVPAELAVLPLIESAFEDRAVSRAGAVGIWQFTRETARRFLRIGRGVDERRDPIRSADAAARLLREHYEVLGSWPLAITAYNHGRSGVHQAVATVGSADLGEIVRRYQGPRFGFASKNFYAEFLAALEVARGWGWDPAAPIDAGEEMRAARAVPPDPSPDPTPPGRRHTVRARESLWTIARHYAVSPRAVQRLNGIRDPRRLRPGEELRIPN